MSRFHFRTAFAAIHLFMTTAIGCEGASSVPGTTDTSASEASTGGDPGTGGTEAPDIAGQWQSPCFEQADGTFARLEFDIAQARWDLDYVVHGEAACASPLVTVHIDGPYEIAGSSDRVDGAHEARFGFATKNITPHAAPLVDALNNAGCGDGAWRIDSTQSVVGAGCAAFGQYPVADCPADFDLVALQDGALHFGARPADNDLCTPQARPSELSPLALRRGG